MKALMSLCAIGNAFFAGVEIGQGNYGYALISALCAVGAEFYREGAFG